MKKIHPYQFAIHAAMIFLIVDVLFISWQYKKLEDSVKGGRSMEILSVGQEMPALLVTDLRTNLRVNHTWKTGKYSLVFFYTTWCPHCHITLPKWEKISTVALIHGCDVVGIIADDPAKAKHFSDSMSLKFNSGTVDSLKQTLSECKISGFPVTYIIDGDGKVVMARAGELTDAQVEEYIKLFL